MLHGRLNALSGDIAEKLLRLVACYVVGCKVLRQVLVGELHREGGVGVGRINREGAGLLAFVSGEIRGEANRAGTRQLLDLHLNRFVLHVDNAVVQNEVVKRRVLLACLCRRIGRGNGRRRPLCTVLDRELHVGHCELAAALGVIRQAVPPDERAAVPEGVRTGEGDVDVGIDRRTGGCGVIVELDGPSSECSGCRPC